MAPRGGAPESVSGLQPSLARVWLADGFCHFDTAPTYGAGYARLALEQVAGSVPGHLRVDSKYGQLARFSVRELLKRTLRAPSRAAWMQSFDRPQLIDRSSMSFWTQAQIAQAFNDFRSWLPSVESPRFYLHAPPVPVLGDEFDATAIWLARQGVELAISSPCAADMQQIFTAAHRPVPVQISVLELLRDLDALMRVQDLDVSVNGLYRDEQDYKRKLGLSRPDVVEKLRSVFSAKESWRLVVGINHVRNLPDLHRLREQLTGSVSDSARA